MVERYAGALFGVILGALVAQCSISARGDHQTYPWALTLVSLNEAGLYRVQLEDIALVHQAASFHAPDSAGRLRWLRLHSQRVLGARGCPPRAPCRWTRPLWDSPDNRPSALAPGAWRPDTVRWVHAQAQALASGALELEPCPVPIATWGNRHDRDFRNGLRIPVRCGKARNFGGTTRAILSRLPGLQLHDAREHERVTRSRPVSVRIRQLR